MTEMTDMKEKAKKVFSAYYDDPQHDPTLNLTDAIREVINQLQQGNAMISAPDVLELCEEIEAL